MLSILLGTDVEVKYTFRYTLPVIRVEYNLIVYNFMNSDFRTEMRVEYTFRITDTWTDM